uniref:Uncharacterized protein n=1 Tax=Oryza punctata TaxID=4537 RepID=A0A0E0M2M4_ORYPU
MRGCGRRRLSLLSSLPLWAGPTAKRRTARDAFACGSDGSYGPGIWGPTGPVPGIRGWVGMESAGTKRRAFLPVDIRRS